VILDLAPYKKNERERIKKYEKRVKKENPSGWEVT
jgi:hypothetical protein